VEEPSTASISDMRCNEVERNVREKAYQRRPPMGSY
jgi:hypothetical protein